ncbi:hypothetical protein FRC00_011498 [Tulasnella sp. 408]|nr:hypothetical protein FRC00_011498 [Tulasnella sp. 408]
MYTSQICIGSTLDGVKGDFPFVLKELTARANSTVQVITDLQLAQLDPKVQMLSPNAQNVKASIEKVGQAMKPGGLCYVYRRSTIQSTYWFSSHTSFQSQVMLNRTPTKLRIQRAIANDPPVRIMNTIRYSHAASFRRALGWQGE